MTEGQPVDSVVCAYRYCDVEFVPTRHNQIYCCQEHTREETNIRLREAYRKDRERRGGIKRVCRTSGCDTVLSRYNDTDYCGRCEAKRVTEKAKLNLEIYQRGNS